MHTSREEPPRPGRSRCHSASIWATMRERALVSALSGHIVSYRRDDGLARDAFLPQPAPIVSESFQFSGGIIVVTTGSAYGCDLDAGFLCFGSGVSGDVRHGIENLGFERRPLIQ